MNIKCVRLSYVYTDAVEKPNKFKPRHQKTRKSKEHYFGYINLQFLMNDLSNEFSNYNQYFSNVMAIGIIISDNVI